MESSKEFPVSFSEVQPFTGEQLPQPASPGVMADAAVHREMAEVQAAMAIAKKFPRNQKKAFERIMVACERPSLAEKALYTYAKGGTDISGPSIRLAEALEQNWGNIQSGVRELEQRIGESVVETYAWDLETNTRKSKVFTVRHIRKARGQYNTLEDPRDIYEMVANQAARRLRSCILAVIPGDIVDAAVEKCEATLKAKADVSAEAVKKMLSAFNNYGVSKEQIEARIQRNLDSITAAQVISLRKIYNSLKDGMSKAEDWFEAIAVSQDEKPKQSRKQRSDAGVTRGSKTGDLGKGGGNIGGTGENPPEPPPDPTEPFLTASHGAEIEAMMRQAGITDTILHEKFGDSLANLPDSMFEKIFGWLADLIAKGEE